MSITGEAKKITEDGVEKDGFSVTFTNGALQQLEELKSFFGEKELLDVLRTSIGFLEHLKREKENEKRSDA